MTVQQLTPIIKVAHKHGFFVARVLEMFYISETPHSQMYEDFEDMGVCCHNHMQEFSAIFKHSGLVFETPLVSHQDAKAMLFTKRRKLTIKEKIELNEAIKRDIE